MRLTARRFWVLIALTMPFNLSSGTEAFEVSPMPAVGGPTEAASGTQSSPSDPATAIKALLKGGKYREAEEASRELLSAAEAAVPPDPVQKSQAMDLLVESLWRGGKFRTPEAQELARQAVSLAEAAYPDSDPRRAVSLTDLGNILLEGNRDYDGALAAFQKALSLREKALGGEDPAVGYSWNDIGKVHEAARNLPEARDAWTRSLSILEKALGPEDPQVAVVVSNLGRVAYLEHDLSTAKNLMERALAIREKALGPDHPDTARTKTNFATILIDLGDYNRAERMGREALAAREKALGPEHPQMASSLSLLAHLLYLNGKTTEAIPLERRAIAILEKGYGPDSDRVGLEVGNLGLLLQAAGDLDAAKESMDRALQIQEKAMGKDKPEIAEMLVNRSILLGMLGQPSAGRADAERALKIMADRHGEENLQTARTQDALARIDWQEGARAAALAHALSESRIQRSQFTNTSTALTEREAMQFEASIHQGLDMTLSVLLSEKWKASADDHAREAWDEVARSRALVLDELAQRHRELKSSSDPELQELAASFQASRESLASLMSKGPEPGGEENYRKQLAESRASRETIERKLSERSASFRSTLAQAKIGIDDAVGLLPKDTALIAFVQFDRISEPGAPEKRGAASISTTPTYVAFVFAGNEIHVRLLGPVAEIDTLVQAWRSETGSSVGALPTSQGQAEARARSAGERLRRRIWDPLKPDLQKTRQVLVVPDGALHLVNLAALPTGGTQYLVESGPLLHYLSSERDLAAIGLNSDALTHPLLFGGADFDGSPGTSASTIASGAATSGPVRAPASTLRGLPASCGDLGRIRFEPLPGSLEEVKTISQLFIQGRAKPESLERDVQSRVGPQADEASFKKLAPGSTLLHVATHGFFYEGDCLSGVADARSKASEGRVTSQSPKPILGENPLLLSGLALAGANARNAPNRCESCDDGILTAEEIAALDLSGIGWVVLSSCDTGLGHLQAGEGVLGLRRSFQISGARTLIMSLWKVEDEPTREWMEYLYEGKLKGLSSAEAVRNASLSVLKARRAKGRSTHPFYWGGFVAAGDWR